MLLKMLKLKFGQVPQNLQAILDRTKLDELEVMTERVFEASSIDEVIGTKL